MLVLKSRGMVDLGQGAGAAGHGPSQAQHGPQPDEAGPSGAAQVAAPLGMRVTRGRAGPQAAPEAPEEAGLGSPGAGRQGRDGRGGGSQAWAPGPPSGQELFVCLTQAALESMSQLAG